MRYLITILVLVVGTLSAQEKDMFLSDFLLEDELKNENLLEKYIKSDFSKLWTETSNHQVLGMIGENHQRIRVVFTSIKRDVNTPVKYKVAGKSKVKRNICDFSGYIKIDSIFEVKKLHYGVDNMYMDSSIVAQGVLFASYELKESPEQNHSGTFKGQLITKWYVNSTGDLKYDKIQSITDGYMNNAFIGSWTQYNSNKSKVCNWADYRIPYSAQDFDVGAGEFSPSKKYYEFGWEQYQRAWLYGDKKAKLEELSEWWK